MHRKIESEVRVATPWAQLEPAMRGELEKSGVGECGVLLQRMALARVLCPGVLRYSAQMGRSSAPVDVATPPAVVHKFDQCAVGKTVLLDCKSFVL